LIRAPLIKKITRVTKLQSWFIQLLKRQAFSRQQVEIDERELNRCNHKHPNNYHSSTLVESKTADLPEPGVIVISGVLLSDLGVSIDTVP